MMWSEKLAGSKTPLEKRKSLEEDWELYNTTPILAANAGQIDDIIPAELLRAKVASALEMNMSISGGENDDTKFGNRCHKVVCKCR